MLHIRLYSTAAGQCGENKSLNLDKTGFKVTATPVGCGKEIKVGMTGFIYNIYIYSIPYK